MTRPALTSVRSGVCVSVGEVSRSGTARSKGTSVLIFVSVDVARLFSKRLCGPRAMVNLPCSPTSKRCYQAFKIWVILIEARKCLLAL